MVGQEGSVFTQENETILHASPLKVWSALTRFGDYEHWNPFIRISGPLVLDAIVQYSFRMKKSKRGFSVINARLSVLEHQRHISFCFGFRGLISVEESYLIAPESVGSRLVHSFHCAGPLSALKLGKLKRNLNLILETTDRQFQRHLRPSRPSAKVKKRVRRGFRPID
jgi:hypothetical protein